MSQIFRFSWPFILKVALVLVVMLSLENAFCQEYSNEDEDAYYVNTEIPIDDPQDALTISTKDLQSISTFSNGPLGLWSAMNTYVLQEDGTLKSSRETGVFSYGSELMQIKEYSWLIAEDELGNELYSDGYFINYTLQGAKLPFAVIREDMITLSELSLANNEAFNSSSVTKLLLYEDFYDSYDIDALNRAFGKSSDVNEVLFRYNPELGSLDPMNESTLDMSLFGDMWSEFGNIFNNPEVMKMFNDFAKEQLERQREEQNNKDNLNTIENMFDKCDGGVCCKWGTTA